MDKKIIFIVNSLCVLLFLILLLAPLASCLGVTPARTTLDFKPGLEKIVDFSVINSGKEDTNLVLYSQGELAKSILFKENMISLKSDEESRQMQYLLKLPDKLEPGLHTAEIVILQVSNASETSRAFVGATVGVTTQVHVFVPYPGKYAEGDMSIINADKGTEATFIIPVVSRGEVGLVGVKAAVDVYNKMGEKITNFETEEVSLGAGEKKDIVYKWKADVPVGAYRAVATILFDGQVSKPIEKQFSIGTPDLELQDVSVKDFNLGDIAKFEMLVENKWSEDIRGAYSQTKVFNKDGAVMAEFKSPTTDIPSFSKTILTSYWDTGGVQEGTYNTLVSLRYGDKSSDKSLELKVSQTNIEVIGLSYVISRAKSPGNTSLTSVLVVGIIVLVLINVVWFLVLRKRFATLPKGTERRIQKS